MVKIITMHNYAGYTKLGLHKHVYIKLYRIHKIQIFIHILLEIIGDLLYSIQATSYFGGFMPKY